MQQIMNKQIVIWSHYRILHNRQNELPRAICIQKDKYEKYNAEWKKKKAIAEQ